MSIVTGLRCPPYNTLVKRIESVEKIFLIFITNWFYYKKVLYFRGFWLKIQIGKGIDSHVWLQK